MNIYYFDSKYGQILDSETTPMGKVSTDSAITCIFD